MARAIKRLRERLSAASQADTQAEKLKHLEKMRPSGECGMHVCVGLSLLRVPFFGWFYRETKKAPAICWGPL